MKKQRGFKLDGWIALDKPAQMTSTQALGAAKRILHPQKAGHAGTLDPLATGCLPIALGEATKTIPYAQDHIKTYSFTVRWGQARTTDDAEGEVTETSDVRPDTASIRAALPGFVGNVVQIPPQFSALKIAGERAYDLARAGQEVALHPRTVHIESLDLIQETPDEATFRAVCGKGTYMRALARDLARALGTVGHIAALRRESVGPFDAKTMISLDNLEKLVQSGGLGEALRPVETVLDDIPALVLNNGEAARLKSGKVLSFVARPDLERLKTAGIDLRAEGGVMALARCGDRPVALVSVRGPEIQPYRILNV